ncbi:CCAAT-binding factor complex subunit HapE [Vairimorpha necatrix]|uniref:CCAAT-binding factor complex subunit HapE n=1 Tax=Vairimorpha necatrix TaxID=6039 RepID=A0AAX4JBT8_9MICR
MRDSNISPDKKLELFWQKTYINATDDRMNLKEVILPLARIKRLMKVEEGVRMVAQEVPIIFSLVAEKFVEELTLRAWINTEESKRRILQIGDISVAVKTSEMFDFLVYVVPRCEMNNVFDRMLSSSDKLYQNMPIVLGKSPMVSKGSNQFKQSSFNSGEFMNDNEEDM